MGLDLYSKIEPYLDFSNEIYKLHKEFMAIIMEKELNNILDVGCGQGYFLQNLLVNDLNYYGIDLSQNQINSCKEKGLNADCIDLKDVKENYDCLTAIFDVLNYIPKDGVEEFLKNAYDRLNDGGYFIFDVNSKFAFEEVVQGSLVIDKDDKFISIDANYDKNELVTDIVLFDRKEDNIFTQEKGSIKQYFHSKDFFKKIMKKVGFKIEDIENFHLYDYDVADKHIYICKK